MKSTNNKIFERMTLNHISARRDSSLSSDKDGGKMELRYSDWFSKEELKHFEDLKPGEGGMMNLGMKKMMVYRDMQSNLHTCSAVYPHLGGVLQ